MQTIRRFFYAVIGFSWPFFYLFHSAGMWDHIYRPFTSQEPVGFWPPFLSSILIYGLAIILFELCHKALAIRNQD